MMHGLSLWAVRTEGLAEAVRVVERARGASAGSRPPAGASALAAAAGGSMAYRVGSVAVVPVIGPLVSRRSPFAWSYEEIADDVDAALADEAVSSIVLDIDSPGGMVSGLAEAAAMIRSASTELPVVAHVRGMGASAAYRLAIEAGTVIASPDAVVGSVGAIIRYVDIEPILVAMGARIVEVVSEASPAKRLDPDSDEGRAELQALVDAAGEAFVEAVAAARSVSRATVLERFGQGRVFPAGEAAGRGMVDRTGSFMETLRMLASRGVEEEPVLAAGRKEAGMAFRMFGGSAPAGAAQAAADEAREADREAVETAASDDGAPEAASGGEAASLTVRLDADAVRETVAASVADALAEERARVAGIMELADGAHAALVAEMIRDGTGVDAAARRILAAERERRNDRLEAIRAADGDAAGLPDAPSPVAGGATLAAVEGDDPEAALKARAHAEWRQHASVREEFSSEKAFVAWRRRHPDAPLASPTAAE